MFRGFKPYKMPVTPQGLKKYDELPVEEAIKLAWTNEGVYPIAHEEAKQVVRDVMPLLARALDRIK